MKKTVNMVKKITAIAAAAIMAVSTLGATVSAQTIAEATNNDFVWALPMASETTVYTDKDSVTMNQGETASVIVTVEGSRDLRIVSSNDSVARGKWSDDGFRGNSIVLNISGSSEGTAKIKIVNKNDGMVLKAVEVNVQGSKTNTSSVYSKEYKYYCFTTGLYYRTWDAACEAADFDPTVIYCGKIACSFSAGFGYEYYSRYDGLYYASYEMALAASHGQEGFVEFVQICFNW